MKRLLCVIALAAVVIVWTAGKISAARLQLQVDALRQQTLELDSLRLEQARLLRAQPTASELETLQHDAAEQARLRATVEARDEAARQRRLDPLASGEWVPARTWQNRGQNTPRATVETALWAAAGGDVAVMKRLFALADDTREKADALLARLPAGMRDRYATAEDLIAEFTIKSIPLGEAQLVWFNQTGEDEANACVFLQRSAPVEARPDPVVSTSEPSRALTRKEAVREALQRQAQRAAARDREPPRAPETPNSSETYLSLHRGTDGWRLVVPPSAVEKIAKELSAPPGS